MEIRPALANTAWFTSAAFSNRLREIGIGVTMERRANCMAELFVA
jgi:hypothetical protein